MSRRALALTGCALALAAFVVAAAPAGAATTLNIIPHGQWELGVSWASTPGILPAETQARMYDRITPLFRQVTDAQLVPSTDGTGYYKSAALVPESDPSLISTENVSGSAPSVGAVSARIKRDVYGVPHIYSDTDAGVIFGDGYVQAEDRSLLINQARFNGLIAAADVPGVSAIQLILGLYSFKPSKSLTDEVTRQQTDALKKAGPNGLKLLADIDTYIAGMNAWYSKNAADQPPITRADIYALNAVKGQLLGEGGGNEMNNGFFLDALRSKLGNKTGDQAFEDLRARNDPEAAVTTENTFTFGAHVSVSKPKGLVRLVNKSFKSAGVKIPATTSRAAAAALRADQTRVASNILIASGKASKTGSPLFVGGPQIGFNYPGLTDEVQLESPGIHVRGATSAPFPGYILIGRGPNDAFTLTSADVDIRDTYAETLCGGSKTKYEYKGKCLKMEKVNAGSLSRNGKTTKLSFYRTVHGSVTGYAKVRGSNETVALSSKRSSYGKDTLDQLFFQALTYTDRIKSAKDFVNAAALTPQTFNSFYASDTEAAFFTSGLFPVRPKGVNPDLPVDGRGKYEWKGFAKASQHPQVINPASGYIVNWNNKPARGFPASDTRFGNEGGIQRVELLNAELKRHEPQALASVLDAAISASTEDVRINRLWPTLKAVLAKGSSPSDLATKAVAQLQAWYDAGGSRVDANLDGKIDAAGVPILDEAWSKIADAGLCDRLGSSLCTQLAGTEIGKFDQPPGGQYSGWHQYMWKDLRAQLGEKVAGPYHLRYCGKGKVATCAKEIWAAIDAAAKKLSASQGADPAAWREAEARSDIEFSPLPLITMQYSNKPTGIHQVMQFGP